MDKIEVVGVAAAVGIAAFLGKWLGGKSVEQSPAPEDRAVEPETAEPAAQDQPSMLVPHFDPRAGRRTIVFDTNALIKNPYCLFTFGSADLVIPAVVIRELDGLKNRSDIGWAARAASAALARCQRFKSGRATILAGIRGTQSQRGCTCTAGLRGRPFRMDWTLGYGTTM